MIKVAMAVAVTALTFTTAYADDPPGSGSGPPPPPAMCGDGIVSGAETCDDGPSNGQPGHCNWMCNGEMPAMCGDGMVGGGESCDEGPSNGQPGHCNATCSGTAADVCGDWSTTGTEACDDGAYNGQPYYCNTTCTGLSEWCGNGEQTGAETCDEGWSNGQPGHCNATCTGTAPHVCGDWQVTGGESCDDGSSNGQPYYCSATCDGMTPWCGDGDQNGTEVCDDGWQNGQDGYCNATCTQIGQRSPFADPDLAPTLQSLSFGRVLGSRHFEALFSLGELPGVGLAPGFGLSIRVRGGGDDGACGASCQVLASTVTAAAGEYVLSEAGRARRFAVDGAGWREVAPMPGIPFRSATAVVVGGDLVVTESDGKLTRTFDAAGRETARTTPWGGVTLAYDGAGRFATATNAVGQVLSASYDGSGRIATVTDPTGFTMTVRYAADGHPISLEGPVDGSVTPNIALGWWEDDVTSVGRLGFNPVQLQYDRGLVTFARDVDGTAYAFQSSATEIAVVDSSMHYRKSTYAGDRVASVESNSGAMVTYVRDGLGRVTSTRHATGGADKVESVTYDAEGRMTSSTDAHGRTRSVVYDAAGNVTSSTDPDGRTTTFAYDAAGRLIATTDPLGRVTSQTYDAQGLVLSTTAQGVTTSMTYNARGQVASTTDAYGVTTTLTYDGLGRVTSQSRPGQPTLTITRTPAGEGEQVVVTRGGDSQTTVTDRYGRVLSETSSDGAAATYAYDQVTGLPSASSETFRGKTQTASQTYTNTGDAAQVWVNGQQRQAAARMVPPGNAWFQP